MNAKQKAEYLIKRYSERVYPLVTVFPEHVVTHYCILCVKEIIDAIEITTGHCELRRVDLQEVDSDILFWKKVIKELELKIVSR